MKTVEQAFCVNGNEGHRWIEEFYDHLPPRVRRRLTNSEFNICAACMTMETFKRTATPRDADFIVTIERFEHMLRNNIKPKPRPRESELWARWQKYRKQR
jgi:hypothetical protein